MTDSYKAFISYHHASDEKVAPALRDALMNLNRAWLQRRAMRVFLDNHSLSASSGLWSDLERTLDSSEFFILLASPGAAKSTWINREVTHWRATKSSGRLLIVVTDGQVVWDPVVGDFDWVASTALPRALEGAFTEEPLWLPLQWIKDSQRQLSIDDPRFKSAVARLAAPMHEMDFDDLVGADLDQRRLTVRRWKTTIALLAVLALAAGTAAIYAGLQRSAAVKQKDEALSQQRLATARQLLAQADAALERDPRTALRLGLAARALDPSAENSLFRLLTATRYTASLPGGRGRVNAVAYAAKEQRFATVHDDGTTSLWNSDDPREPRPIGQPFATDGAQTLAFSPDGRTLAIAGRSRSIELWHLTDDGAAHRSGTALEMPGDGTRTLAYSPDGRVLAAAGAGRTVVLWDMTASPRQLGDPLTGHNSEVNVLAFSPDGHTLASGATDGPPVLWDLTDLAHPRRSSQATIAEESSLGGIRALAFAAPGILAAAGTLGRIDLWDVRQPSSPIRISLLPSEHRGGITTLALAPDGKTLASGSDDRTAILWDLTELARPVRIGAPLSGHNAAVTSLAFAPDGRSLVTVADDGGSTVWSTSDLTPAGRDGLSLSEPGQKIGAVAFTADGRLAAVGGKDIALWNLIDPARPTLLNRVPLKGSDAGPVIRTPEVVSLAFASGRPMLAATDTVHPSTALWNLTDPATPQLLDILDSGQHADLSPAGDVLVTIRDRQCVILTDLSTRAQGQCSPGGVSGSVEVAKFLPGGRGLITFESDGTFTFRRLTGEEVKSVRSGLTRMRSVALSADGNKLALGDIDGAVVLWDISDPEAACQIGRFPAGYSAVTGLAFAPDSRILVVAADTTVAAWDVADPAAPSRLAPQLTGFRHGVNAVYFPGDGRTIGVLTGPGSALLWDATNLSDLRTNTVKRACQRSRGGLDRADWTRFVPALPHMHSCPG